MDTEAPATWRFRILAIGALLAAGCAETPIRAHPAPPRDDPAKPAEKASADPDLEDMRVALLEAHNRIRAEAKLKKLTINRKLQAAAQAHALDMASRREMSHKGSDGSAPTDRIKARGYKYFRVGENVAAGRLSAERVMRGWMDSPPHKKNILGGFSEIGVGCAVGEDGKRYWCVTFGLPSVH